MKFKRTLAALAMLALSASASAIDVADWHPTTVVTAGEYVGTATQIRPENCQVSPVDQPWISRDLFWTNCGWWVDPIDPIDLHLPPMVNPTVPVPEPAAWVLMIAGIVTLAVRRSRKETS